MNHKYCIYCIFICLLSTIAFSQIQNHLSFYPSDVGNKWLYRYYPSNSEYQVVITKDSSGVDNDRFIFINGQNVPTYKIDSLHQVYQYSNAIYPNGQVILGPEYLLYKLSAAAGDSFYTMNQSFIVKVSTFSQNVFSKLVAVKDYTRFSSAYGYVFGESTIAEGFGLIYANGAGEEGFLIGCVINEVSYGVPLAVTKEIGNIPSTITLHQNYPNPFNPATRIRYELSKKSSVKLTVYDCLGVEITTLVNGENQKGIHTIQWNSINYPSGVYFARLLVDNHAQIIKMQLIK